MLDEGQVTEPMTLSSRTFDEGQVKVKSNKVNFEINILHETYASEPESPMDSKFY